MGEAMLLEATVETATLSSFLTDVTSVLTTATGWVATVASTIRSEPLLLLSVILPFVGFGVYLFRRLLHV